MFILRKKRIIVAVTSDVYSDMRVMKVSNYLVNRNADIIVVGRNTKSFELNTKFQIKLINLVFNRSFLFYLEFNLRFLFFGLFKKVDIVVANDLDTLLASYILSKIKKADLVYDSHEFFTESVGLQGRRFPRFVWLILERWLLPKVKNAYTVSKPIADAYYKKYAVRFELVRNYPAKIEDIIPIQDDRFTSKKIILYQGVFNAHRGLEDVIYAMNFLPNDYIFLLIGYGELEQKLRQITKESQLNNRVYFLGKLPYDEMMRFTAIADLGIALEAPVGDSFKYSLPNKVFDYIQVGLPFISLGTPEVKKIIDQYHVGKIISYFDSKELANCILLLAENKKELDELIYNQEINKRYFTWENESINLDKVYNPLFL